MSQRHGWLSDDGNESRARAGKVKEMKGGAAFAFSPLISPLGAAFLSD